MLLALAAALSTLDRWLDRRRQHDLAWTVAFGLFAIAAGALALGSAQGWDEATFRVFFLFGAVANVPVLALGTAWLHASPAAARRWTAVVALGVAFAAGVVAAAPLTAPIPPDGLAQGSDVFGALPRVLAAVGSGGGALVILVGAVRSAVRRIRPLANALVAAGVAVSGASGLLNSVADEETAFAATLAAGIALILAGYLVGSTTPAEAGQPSRS